MPPDRHTIPREALPPGWGPAETGEDGLAYRLDRPAVELVATRTDADGAHPALGLGQCWELRCRLPVGNHPVCESIGRVSTRRAAVDGLLECMTRIHESVADLDDPLEIQSTLGDVSLGDLVPGDSPV